MANKNAGNNGKDTRFKSGAEAAAAGRKGGLASAESRRLHKTFREIDLEETTDDEIKAMLSVVKKMGKRGNINAIRLYMEMTGMDKNNDSDVFEDDGFIAALKGQSEDLFANGDDSGMIEQEA